MASKIRLDDIQMKASVKNFEVPSKVENDGYIKFGAIHLKNTDLNVATDFWTRVIGMKLRKLTKEIAEFGSEKNTLIVVHQTAKSSFKEGFSGLYHYAIHVPNMLEFARMIQRLNKFNYSFYPVDHTMSKSLYLRDPDNVFLEFALETPERFKKVIRLNGLFVEDSDGKIRVPSEELNIVEINEAMPDLNTNLLIHDDTKIGHIHFYASNLEKTNMFYKMLGFNQFNYLEQYFFADLDGGGNFKHSIAINCWHGLNKPIAPESNAGLHHFNIVFQNQLELNEALNRVKNYIKSNNGYWLVDPSGNKLCLRCL